MVSRSSYRLKSKEKNKYCVCVESRKMVQVILFAKQKQRHREQCVDAQGERDGGGMNREIGTDIYTLLILCVKWTANESLMYSPGNSVMT